jgi:GTP-binding protein EngB required for normal cell division
MNNHILNIGSVSTGKSTFINAIVQKNLLEMGVGRTTTVKCKVIDPIRHFTDGIPKEYENDEALGVLNQLELIDLPGLNDSKNEDSKYYNRYIEKYYSEIQNALGIFYLFTEENIETAATDMILEKLADARKHLTHKNIYVILNKVDKLGAREIEKLVNIIKKKLKQYNLNVNNIIPISAKYGLLSKLFTKYMNNNDELNENKLTEEQLADVKKILYGRRGKTKAIEDISAESIGNMYDISNFHEIVKLLAEFSVKVQLTKQINVIENVIRYVNETQGVHENKIVPYNIYNDAVNGYKEYCKKNKVKMSAALISGSLGFVVFITIGSAITGGVLGGVVAAGIAAGAASVLTASTSVPVSFAISNVSKKYIEGEISELKDVNRTYSMMNSNLKYYIDRDSTDEKKDSLEIAVNAHDSLKLFNKASLHVIKIEGFFKNFQLNKEKEFSIIILNDRKEYTSYTNADL